MSLSKPPTYPGAVATIGHGKRIGIPKGIFPAATAWHGLKGPTEVIAEVRDIGHLRVYLPEDVADHVASVRRDLESQEGDPGALDQLTAMDLRFHQISYYPDERRFRLTEEVLGVLDGAERPQGRCYVQVVRRAIDILTVHRLAALQVNYRRQIGID